MFNTVTAIEVPTCGAGFTGLARGPVSITIHQLIDMSQNFGYGAIKLDGDLLADLDGVVQTAREGRIFDNRDAAIVGDAANAQRQRVFSLRDH